MSEIETPDRPRILIVEDDPVIARGLAQRLRNLDYEVSAIASTGEDAIQSAGDESPDLVLMDIRLEGDMSGTEAAARIRSSLNIPIVFVTAHADEVSLERAKAGEPFGYLVKPYSERELRSTVETALYKARAEKRLIKAKEEWERTFDAVPDLIMILDDRHRILRANKATADALGMTPEALVGQTCFQCIHGQDAPVSTCPHSRLLADGAVHHSEVAEGRLGGVFEMSVSPLYDAQGRLSGSVHVAHNITTRKKTQDALRESEQRYRQLVEKANDIIFRADSGGFFTFVNPVASRITGYSEEELVGHHYLEFIHPSHRRDAERFYGIQFLKQVIDTYYEFPIVTKQGSTIWLGQSVRLLTDTDSVVGFQAIARDISERRKVEDALRKARDELEDRVRERTSELVKANEHLELEIRERIQVQVALQDSEHFHRTVLAGISDAVFLTDDDGAFTFICPDVAVIFGYSFEEVREMGEISALLGPGLFDLHLLRSQGEIRNIERTIKDNAGEDHLLLINVKHVSIRQGSILYSCRDMTEPKQTEERLQRLAHYDPLTGLANRVLFRDRLKRALAQARRHKWMVALMLIDLDRFKDVNDTLGHSAGDRVLISVADRLRECVRESDTVARLGGDEFIVVLPVLHDARRVSRIGDRIREAMTKPFHEGGRQVHLSTSIGTTLWPGGGDDDEELLRNADIALYRAKELGRNRLEFFSAEMNRDLLERAELEAALRRALEHGDLVLHYQPQVDFETGRIVCAEALLRWSHPTRGPMSPAKLIPLAEDSGLIVSLGEWVLRTACEQAVTWQKAGMPAIRVAVNVSGVQMKHPGFKETVVRILDDTGLDPTCLELELTETVTMEETETAREILGDLKITGISVAVDDFGTGYSSLSYLKHLAVDKLKIDRSFVKDIESNSDDKAIVAAIVRVGHSLGLKVIAEGIETRRQFDYLWALGCNVWQGYFFSPAVTKTEFTRMLAEDRRAFAYQFQWSPDLSVGVKTIDGQHKAWIERVNELCRSILAGEGIEDLANMIDFLTEYSQWHFRDEETLMLEHNYPALAKHRRAHESFANQVQGMRTQMVSNEITADAVLSFVADLYEWFCRHIKEEDRALGNYLQAGGAP